LSGDKVRIALRPRASDDPEARWRRETARDPDDSGPGDSDRRETADRTDLRGGSGTKCLYGYRPKRSAQDAIQEVHEALCEGYTDVVDADLSKYFDTIPHFELLQCVARRIVDKHILHLLKMWLKVPVEETDDKAEAPTRGARQGKKRLTGGKGNDRGTPDHERRPMPTLSWIS
jgi:hypothetical protein